MDIKRAWEQRLNEVSAVFKTCPELSEGSASFSVQVLRTYFVNSEGSVVVQNRIATRVMLMASLKAADGMELPLNRDYFAYTPDDLPDNDRMIADARDMIKRLLALRDAPVADPYTGPAILGVLSRDLWSPSGRPSLEIGRSNLQEDGGRASAAC